MNKPSVVHAFRSAVAADLAALAQVTADARQEATGDESRAEDKYDTRATEASYLAAGQGRRLDALKQLATWLHHLDPSHRPSAAGLGALVELRDEHGGSRWVLVGPVGGPRIEVEGHVVSLISLSSPLGESLEGAQLDEEVELDTPQGERTVVVAALT